ncbi:hypothetical protein COMNV_01416 [Commensalibacter sp. Nvir]|uniref:GNAT family N-acetyltransferase n=1 Tax=Commensalibacter sp. Nvir TaxID=3069817 RepID=UPI002D5895FC|nr:hypothetical protein COMNV_01416 [Commensalibacter sp. Nvir]
MIESDITTHFAKLSHLNTIMEIQKRCYHAIEPEPAEILGLKIRSNPNTCFIATYKGTIRGYLLSIPALLEKPPVLNATAPIVEKPNCLYLHDLSINPDARGLGIANCLVKRFFSALSDKNLDKACLVSVQNSQKFWHHYGFYFKLATGTLKDIVTTYGETAVYMEYHSPH